MKRAKRKLCAHAGASITFALLLFLVCAVLCAVIIAAATASVGRLVKIGAVDQRYYAVTSASAVLRNMIDGKTVTVSEVLEKPEGTPTDVYVLDGVASGTRETELIAASAAAEQTITRDAATRYYNSKYKKPESERDPFSSQTSMLSLTLEGTSVPNPCPLDLTVVESFEDNGNLILTVGNEHSFQQKLVFSVTESENNSERTYYSTNAAGEVITQTEYIHNYVLTWSLAGVEVVGAAVQ